MRFEYFCDDDGFLVVDEYVFVCVFKGWKLIDFVVLCFAFDFLGDFVAIYHRVRREYRSLTFGKE
jgi:hypothetical protein